MQNQENTARERDNGNQTANTDAPKSNNPAVDQYGPEVIKAWTASDRQRERGDQLGIYVMFQAAFTHTLTATVQKKDGEVEDTQFFDIEDWCFNDPKKSDGNPDRKMAGARNRAVLEQVFSVELDKLTREQENRTYVKLNKLKSVLQFMLGDARHYDGEGKPHKLGPDDVELSKTNKIKLPYTVFNEPPKADASDNERALYNAMRDKLIELDGKEGRNVESLIKRSSRYLNAKANEKKGADQNGNSAQEQRVASFKAALNLVASIVPSFIADPENETEEQAKNAIAPNEEMRAMLWQLQIQLASYFEADPLDDEQREKIEAKMRGEPVVGGKEPQKDTRASKG